MTELYLYPIYAVEILGSSIMIILSLSALFFAWKLTRIDPKSVLWTYFLWFSLAMVAFALSRSTGHLIRYILIGAGIPGLWDVFRPYSGTLNTVSFIVITTLTFYFPNVRNVLGKVLEDAKKLSRAKEELRKLNLQLEQRVEDRTRELRESEEKFRRLFENSKDIIFFCDSNLRINDINNSGMELLGCSDKNEIIGRPLSHFFIEDTCWHQYRKKMCEQGHIKDFETTFRRKDGEQLSLMITAAALRDERGKIIACEGIAKDITRFKQVSFQLAQSEKMISIGQLAAGIAHEINTPLGIILGYTQLLEEDFDGKKDVLEPLQIIERQTNACRRIMTDLLKFSREAPKNVMASVNINHCMEEILSVVEHSLNMNRIYIHRAMTSDLPEILGDCGRLQQVFINIINNAHYAIGKEGIIGIWTMPSAQHNMVEIIIADTGPGISPEIIKKIFDPFFTTKEVGKGTGLGLSVSFGIIKDHGGEIQAESPPSWSELLRLGMNTAFIIRLPIFRCRTD